MKTKAFDSEVGVLFDKIWDTAHQVKNNQERKDKIRLEFLTGRLRSKLKSIKN